MVSTVRLVAAALVTLSGALTAQDSVVVRRGRLDARSAVARRGVDLFNAPGTTRFFGETTIAAGDRIAGDVGFFEGPVVIAGVIRGDVIAINTAVRLEPGAEIRGEVLVFGGVLTGLDGAEVLGNTRTHRQGLSVTRVAARLELLADTRPAQSRPRDRRWRGGRGLTRFSIELGSSGMYNRVEGLPLEVGPRISRGGSRQDPEFLLEGFGIFRTARDFSDDREDIGYLVRTRLNPGRNDRVVIDGRIYDRVAPVEDWHLHADEIGLASFLWHRDYRDYYLQRGVSGTLSIFPVDGFEVFGTIARNEETSIGAVDPWTPFRGDDVWRANPAVDEATFTSWKAGLRISPRAFGRDRWFFHVEWERGISDDVAARPLPAAVREAIPAGERYQFDRAMVDLRLYEPVGRNAQLSLRAAAAGTVGGDDLPVQRRLSLGGPGALPGFPFRRFSCNATVFDPSSPALCDRMMIFQAEYRTEGLFGRSRGWRDNRRRGRTDWQDWWDADDWFWFEGPTLVLFGDAGAAWISGDGPGPLEWNVGAGIEFGSLGVYAAKAIEDDEALQMRLRVHRRF